MVRDDFSADDLPNSLLRDVYAYWRDMKGDRLMPSRSDLNPADIVKLLPGLLLIDVEQEPRRYKCRLMGTETVAVINADHTGRYLDELPRADLYLKEKYDWLVREKRPYFYTGNAKWVNKSYIEYSTIVLPLSSDGKTVDIVMVGVKYQFSSEKRAGL